MNGSIIGYNNRSSPFVNCYHNEINENVVNNVPLLYKLQRVAYESVIEAVFGECRLFFMDGPWGA